MSLGLCPKRFTGAEVEKKKSTNHRERDRGKKANKEFPVYRVIHTRFGILVGNSCNKNKLDVDGWP